MFTILFRKMRSTKWMVVCLFIGFLMAAGMMSTVPIYMDASLQRMLIKDMQSYQTGSGTVPGQYNVTRELQSATMPASQLEVIDTLGKSVEQELASVAIPPLSVKTTVKDNMLYIIKGSSKEGNAASRVKIVGMTGIADHIELTSGTMYCEGGIDSNGVVEVIINEEVIKQVDIALGNEYEIKPVDTSKPNTRVRVVGIYKQLTDNDVYWAETMESYLNALITDMSAITGTLIPNGNISVTEVSVRAALDYQSMDMNDLGAITAAIAADEKYFTDAGYSFEMNIASVLGDYKTRADDLTRILWVLQIPTMVMLGFYLFMVSKLNVEQEKNEIAVFKSRGASGRQILGIYAMEAGVLGVATLVIAPFIGLLLCSFLGVSNGFLEFVNRSGIAAKVTPMAILYALLAVAVFFITTMIPIIPASKLTIVGYKQSKAKVVKMSLWEKCCIDIILIAASSVFLIIYNNSLSQAMADGTFVATGQLDPLLFIFSTCLVMGLGLLFIRVYPYLLRLIYMLFKPFWTPSQYMAVTTVCRSQGGKERFLMLFLVVCFSFGLFSANTARAINNNKEDRINYSVGADVTLMEYWLENTGSEGGDTSIAYKETDFSKYETLEGVELATKVLRNESAKLKLSGATQDDVTLMAIEPDKFAQTAWFRGDLLPVHWWNYCNALTDADSGILISQSLADKYEITLGEEISVKLSGNDYINATVLAIIGYWPGINPNEMTEGRDSHIKDFAVMNYNYVRKNTELAPYEIWLKMKQGATSEALYADITAKRLPIQQLNDASQSIVTVKTEPQLQGMNGALTLGFIIIMIMTIIGFLIYWILSIKSRTLQFGILRAMGMSFREIIGILIYEQILVSGASIAIAFVIGGVASDLFVPLFQSMYDVIDQIPPFRVAAMRSDYIKIYAIIVLMLGGGSYIISRIIRKININKALKLGED